MIRWYLKLTKRLASNSQFLTVPSATELTILAVVVAIRIVLSWSLSKEIDRHYPYVQDNDDKNTMLRQLSPWGIIIALNLSLK
jgi:hypothetical protein